jgi:hypothetical protein
VLQPIRSRSHRPTWCPQSCGCSATSRPDHPIVNSASRETSCPD